jgi:hypothetical protein
MQAITLCSLVCLVTITLTMSPSGAAQGQTALPDERARETEAKMTDDERFSLIVSVIGAIPSLGAGHVAAQCDKRIRCQEHERGLHARRPAARHPGAAEQRRQHLLRKAACDSFAAKPPIKDNQPKVRHDKEGSRPIRRRQRADRCPLQAP